MSFGSASFASVTISPMAKRQLIGTRIRPARMQANCSSNVRVSFSAIVATRSRGCRPKRWRSSQASRPTRRSSSAQVSATPVSTQVTAFAAGVRAP